MSATARQAASGSAHLIDQWSKNLRFAGRAPRTLEEFNVARAEYDHGRRLAEIKAMRAKLALLGYVVPALANAGVRLADRDITTWDGGKSLRIQPPMLTRDNKLHAALLELGFKEVERGRSVCQDVDVTLKHGRSLVLRITIRATEGGAA